jgi:hypothetical protein
MQPFDVTRVTERGGTMIDDYLRNDPGPYSYVGVMDDDGNKSGDLRWYVNWVKGETAEIEWMSPAEYLRRCDREDRRNTARTLEIAEAMEAGEVFGMPWYSEDGDKTHYLGSSQEGAHRAAAAEMLGVETIPVVVIRDFPKGAHLSHVLSWKTDNETSWCPMRGGLAYELYDGPHSDKCVFAGYVTGSGNRWRAMALSESNDVLLDETYASLDDAKVYVEALAPQNEKTGYATPNALTKGIVDMNNLSKRNDGSSKVADATVGGGMSIPAKVEAMSYDGTLIDYELHVHWTIDTFGGGSNVTEVCVEDIAYELADELINDASGDDVADLVRDVAADNDIIIDDSADAAIAELTMAVERDIAKAHRDDVPGRISSRKAASFDPLDIPEYPEFIDGPESQSRNSWLISYCYECDKFLSIYSVGMPEIWCVCVSDEWNGNGLGGTASGFATEDDAFMALADYLDTGNLHGPERVAKIAEIDCVQKAKDLMDGASIEDKVSFFNDLCYVCGEEEMGVEVMSHDEFFEDVISEEDEEDAKKMFELGTNDATGGSPARDDAPWYTCNMYGGSDYAYVVSYDDPTKYMEDTLSDFDIDEDLLAEAAEPTFGNIEIASVEDVQIVKDIEDANGSSQYTFRRMSDGVWRDDANVFAVIDAIGSGYSWTVIDEAGDKVLGEGKADTLGEATDACVEVVGSMTITAEVDVWDGLPKWDDFELNGNGVYEAFASNAIFAIEQVEDRLYDGEPVWAWYAEDYNSNWGESGDYGPLGMKAKTPEDAYRFMVDALAEVLEYEQNSYTLHYKHDDVAYEAARKRASSDAYITITTDGSGTLVAELGCDDYSYDGFVGKLMVTLGEIPDGLGYGDVIDLTQDMLEEYGIDLSAPSEDIGYAVLDMLDSYEPGHFSSVKDSVRIVAGELSFDDEHDEGDMQIWVSNWVDDKYQYSIAVDWNGAELEYELCREDDGTFLGDYPFEEGSGDSQEAAWNAAVNAAEIDLLERRNGIKLPRDYWGNPITGAKTAEDVNKFTYMMLDRLKQDCEYYLGYGERYDGALWAGSVDGQIAKMHELWDELPDDGKPEWLTLNDIDDYERRMKDDSVTAAQEAPEVSEADRMPQADAERYGFADAYDMSGKIGVPWKVFVVFDQDAQGWAWVVDYGDGPEEKGGDDFDTAQEACDDYVENYLPEYEGDVMAATKFGNVTLTFHDALDGTQQVAFLGNYDYQLMMQRNDVIGGYDCYVYDMDPDADDRPLATNHCPISGMAESWLEGEAQKLVNMGLVTAARTAKSKGDFAYTPTDNESDWKLDISDKDHAAMAKAALGKGYRGNKVKIPEADRQAVIDKVNAACEKFGIEPYKGASRKVGSSEMEWNDAYDVYLGMTPDDHQVRVCQDDDGTWFVSVEAADMPNVISEPLFMEDELSLDDALGIAAQFVDGERVASIREAFVPGGDALRIGKTLWLAYAPYNYDDIDSEVLVGITYQSLLDGGYGMDFWWDDGNAEDGGTLTACATIERYDVITHQIWDAGELETVVTDELSAACSAIMLGIEAILAYRKGEAPRFASTAGSESGSFALDPRVPDDVDSQKNNQTCPLCGSDSFDGERCSTCGYEVAPDGFDDIDIDDDDVEDDDAEEQGDEEKKTKEHDAEEVEDDGESEDTEEDDE